MSRQLKFRVYIPDHEKFTHFQLGDFDYSDRYLHQHEYPVQQFIGVCDKNGKEIYEGDIVQYYNNSSWDGINLEVKWDIANLAWIFSSKKEGVLEQIRLCFYRKDDKMCYDKIEVIGNIFENKTI